MSMNISWSNVAICSRRRYQPVFLWVFALSIIIIPRETLAFLHPASSLQTNQRHFSHDTKSLVSLPPRHYQCSQLSMVAKSGGKIIATTEQFEQEVLLVESSAQSMAESQKKLTLVLFTAPWCGPCRLTNPVVKEIMKQYQSKLEVVEISTDDLPEVASNVGVSSIPTIQVYHGGKVKDTIVGCVSKNVLAKAVDKVLEDLGMLGAGEEKEGDVDSERESS